MKVGYSTDRYYLREWAGVDPKNGAPLWYKNDGSGETTSNYSEAKQVMTEATSPKLFGGFNTSLTWKNIDLNASFGFSLGGKIYNYSRQEYDSDGAYTDRNQMKLIDGWSRWEKKAILPLILLPLTETRATQTRHLPVIWKMEIT